MWNCTTLSRCFVRTFQTSGRCVAAETQITLTKDVYDIKRGDYAIINDADLQHFERILTNDRVLTDANDVASYNVDWIKMVRGKCYS